MDILALWRHTTLNKPRCKQKWLFEWQIWPLITSLNASWNIIHSPRRSHTRMCVYILDIFQQENILHAGIASLPRTSLSVLRPGETKENHVGPDSREQPRTERDKASCRDSGVGTCGSDAHSKTHTSRFWMVKSCLEDSGRLLKVEHLDVVPW